MSRYLKHFSLGKCTVQCHTDVIDPALNTALLLNALSCLICLPSRQEQVKSHTHISIPPPIPGSALLRLPHLPLTFADVLCRNFFRRLLKGDNNVHTKGVFKIFSSLTSFYAFYILPVLINCFLGVCIVFVDSHCKQRV